jgi:SAM-dependent methyltransferase
VTAPAERRAGQADIVGGGSGRRGVAEVTATRAAFPDWRFAPNIGGHPDVYEIENRALDPDGHVLAAMHNLAPWDDRTLVDLGCGTGFWLPGYARDAARVIGVEPDPALRARAEARIRGLPRAEVIPGSAEHLPLPDRSADVVHARFAYFLTPGIVEGIDRTASVGYPCGCSGIGGASMLLRGAPGGGSAVAGSGTGTAAGNGEGYAAGAPGDAGLAEVMRVLKPGGSLIVVDNDYRWGEFADLLAAAAMVPPHHTASAIDAWWRDRGATRHEVRSRWRCTSREDLATVLGIEVPAAVARAWLARHPAATGLTYGHVLFAVSRDSVSRSLTGPHPPPTSPSPFTGTAFPPRPADSLDRYDLLP